MKKWINYFFWVLLLGGIIAVFIYANKQRANYQNTDPKITIHTDGEHVFITKEELILFLKEKGLFRLGQTYSSTLLNAIEKMLVDLPEVKSVNVYSSVNGALFIDVTLRNPIVHVYNQFNESFYLDEGGYIVPANYLHPARVLVANGYIEDRISSPNVNEIINNDSLKTIYKIDNLFHISKYVCNDPLLQPLIGQVYRRKNGDFVLVPIVGGQQIIFGSANTEEEIEEKFKKLKIFYKEGIPYEGWNTYSEINLKYAKQIVCTKKE